MDSSFGLYTTLEASRYGHLHILKWAYDNGCHIDTDQCIRSALQGSHLDIVTWLCNEFRFPRSFCIVEEAAHYDNNIHILEWVMSTGYQVNLDKTTVCTFAAEKGDLQTLKWARTRGFSWDEEVCKNAAKFGHIELLKWSRENGCPWKENVFEVAAENGHYEVMIWVHENGCPINNFILTNQAYVNIYAERGYLDILKFTRSMGIFSIINKATWNHAVSGGHINVLEWLLHEECPTCNRACGIAANKGNLEILKWLDTKGIEFPYDIINDVAIKYHDSSVEMFNWFTERKGIKFGLSNLGRILLYRSEMISYILKWAMKKGYYFRSK
jgi:hypothetical protein